MRLRRVDEERVAEIDVTRFASGTRKRFPFRQIQFFSQLEKRQSGIPCRLEDPRYVEVRTDPDARRRIIDSHVREEEQHQERTAARRHVDAHRTVFAVEASVNVPACVARIVSAGETNREGSKTRARQPPFRTHELIEGSMQVTRVRGLSKGRLPVVAKTHDGPGPCRWLIRVASSVAPQQIAAASRELLRKGALHKEKSAGDELLDLFFSKHEMP
jgi:hypothetical protein